MVHSAISPDLHAGFSVPSPEHSPVPIWWWSGDKLEVGRMKEQIDALVSQGVHNAVVLNLAPTGPAHGALSDDPQMMTPEWWAIWDELCAHSLNVGMRLWFYDQFGFSGANIQGRLAVDEPSFVGMALHRLVVEAERSGEIGLPETGVILSVTATAFGSDGSAGAPQSLAVTAGVARWQGTGKARLSVVYALRQGFDYHSRAACAKLIDSVHGEFERRLGTYFRKSIAGSFQDELPSVPTWSARFAEEFKQRCGYDLLPVILALWEDWGPESARYRIDYQRVRAQLAEEALFKPLFDWHESHGLIFGVDQQSPARAGEPLGATDQYADYARTHRWYSAPGSDHWGDAKFHSSLAHHYGRPRTWIEAFHSSGWGGTLEETFDWLQPWILAGANLYDPHAVFYSTRGGQWEWAPPSTCWRQPYWRHYKHFADAVSRLCWLATRGEHVCDIGVLFPSAAVQADLFLDHAGKKGRAAHGAYMELLGSMIWFNTQKGALPRMLRDFDVLDDDTVAGARIAQGELKTRAEAYKAVIFPHSFLMETATLERLCEFAENGGLLLFVGGLPEMTDRIDGDKLLARLAGLKQQGKVSVVTGGELLRSQLEAALEPIARRASGAAPILQRRVGDLNVLFTTAAPEGSATAQPMLPWAYWNYDTDVFSFPRFTGELGSKGYDFDPARNVPSSIVRIAGAVGLVELWDPASGRCSPAPTRVVDGMTEVTVDFSGSPMVALVWSATGTSAAPQPVQKTETSMPIEGLWRARLVQTMDNRYGDFTLPAKPGSLPIQAWKLDYVESGETTPETLPAAWERVAVTHGPRAWQFGPATSGQMPTPLNKGHDGPLEEQGWSEISYSLSRGIDHDSFHDKMLGPKARVPEMFWRVRNVPIGQSIQYRVGLPISRAGVVTLALGANGTKDAWWNGERIPEDGGGYLHMAEVDARAGLNILEYRITAVGDDFLAGYWAVTEDRDAFERPEWLTPDDGGKAGTVVTFRRVLDLKAGDAVEAHFGSQGPAASLSINGVQIGMHGSFDPYDGWVNPKTMKYDLTPHLKTGSNIIEVGFTDAGRPLAMYFDGTIAANAGNEIVSIVSNRDWQIYRQGKPISLRLMPPSRHDPRWTVLHPRPHPLPRSNWLDPSQPLAGVLDIVPDPYPTRARIAQWFRVMLPPGATKATVPISNAQLALFVDKAQLTPMGENSWSIPASTAVGRMLYVRATLRDGRRAGAVWDGPISFECDDGVIGLGSWSDMGLDFYSGGIEYRQEVQVAYPTIFGTLDLGRVRGTCEVEINGKPAGVRIWSPYRFDVSHLLVPGQNTIVVRVFNTLGPYISGSSPSHFVYKGQTISGILGPVRLC